MNEVRFSPRPRYVGCCLALDSLLSHEIEEDTGGLVNQQHVLDSSSLRLTSSEKSHMNLQTLPCAMGIG